MKEKIFIEDGLCLYKKSGTGQYTENLYKILKELGYDIIMPRKSFMEKIKNATIKRILYVAWLNLIFPFILYSSGCSKIFFTNTMTPFYKFPKKEFYPVLHDLWAYKLPETMSKTKRDYQNLITSTIKNVAQKIITVSYTVKQEIIDFYNCKDDFVGVIYNYFSFGENPQINATNEEQNQLLNKYDIKSKKYILSVANLNKRKNLPALIDAYNSIESDVKLVLVGAKQNESFGIQNPNIIFTGYITDEEIKILYKHSLLYAFPSLYEGFGIPLIDAQSFGVPVLCSDLPIFHEVGGNSVEFCNVDSNGIKEKLSHLLNNTERQEELITLGEKNSKRFNLDNLKNQVLILKN